jgi:hypothetical protein
MNTQTAKSAARPKADPMLNAVHEVGKRVGALEVRMATNEQNQNDHAEDDRKAFAGVHTALDDLGTNLTRQMSGMIATVQSQVDTLTKDKIEAAAYARGVKDARTPSPARLAFIQGASGPIVAAVIAALMAGAASWIARDAWEGPHHHETTATSTVTVTRPAR